MSRITIKEKESKFNPIEVTFTIENETELHELIQILPYIYRELIPEISEFGVTDNIFRDMQYVLERI